MSAMLSQCLHRCRLLVGILILIAAVGRADDPASAVAANNPSGAGPRDSVDLRPRFDSLELTPRVQGDRNTCSVFVVTGAIEYAVAAQQPRAPRLSVEFLNWAANQVTQSAEDGGFFSDLWNGFVRYGLCAEDDMPYRAKFDSATPPSDVALTRARAMHAQALQIHWIKPWDPHVGLTDEQLQEVRRVLSRRVPVCGGFLWPKEPQWQDGVLQLCPRDRVRDGHSVLLVGYRDDPAQPGGGVFLIRNSSGPSRDGWMPYAYAREYMNDAAWIDAAHQTNYLFQDTLGSLASTPIGRSRRVSSNEQPQWNDANLDMTWLQPGQTLEMPRLEGPGVINHMWFTSHAGWANELNALSLRIYWDDRSEPGVEVPLGDFFSVGQGKPAEVNSVPVQVSPTGSLTCYWRMPFAKSARIVIRNDNPDRGAGLYWQVDWVQLDQLPLETPYFHAQYRQEYPAQAGRDYVIADLRGTGQYVGSVLSVTLAQDGWFGEGDDFFYIDGEEIPSLQGTGSEDYFNDAWGFRARTTPWFGQPRWQGDQAGDSGVCYRWHVLDPVGFHESLRVTMEHKGNYEDDLAGFYVERPDFFSSVAFWYQVGIPARFTDLPSWEERRVPWRHQHLVQQFQHAQVTGSARLQIQTQGLFGARPLLLWPNTELGERMTVPFTVEEAGTYALRLTALQGPPYGRYKLLLDDQPVNEADFGGAADTELDLPICLRALQAGPHTLTFEAVAGASSSSPAKPLAVEMLRLLKLPPQAGREVKTHHEAHFVRLGIGRALYAYRLVYGTLPDSLPALVDAGMLPARYLQDENGLPLKYWRDGEYMVVESPAPGGWQHRWQGRDPRR